MLQEWPIRIRPATGLMELEAAIHLWQPLSPPTMWNFVLYRVPGCRATAAVVRQQDGIVGRCESQSSLRDGNSLYKEIFLSALWWRYNRRERHSSPEHSLFYKAQSLWWFWWEHQTFQLFTAVHFLPFKSVWAKSEKNDLIKMFVMAGGTVQMCQSCQVSKWNNIKTWSACDLCSIFQLIRFTKQT